jgi:hypothetical protein
MDSPWETTALGDLVELVWTGLAQAVEQPGHPWHLAVLGTQGKRTGPNARMVVLRGITRPGYELLAFSDTRTQKVQELSGQHRGVWVFYDPIERVQVRAFTETRLHSHDAVADTYWHRLPDGHRAHYQTESPPGSELPEPGNGQILAPGGTGEFTVIIGKIVRVDWLWLRRQGHRRAEFLREGSGWRGRWTVP